MLLFLKAHGTDLLNSFGDQEMTDYFIYFARSFDPNGIIQTTPWPQYDLQNPRVLIFQDDLFFPVVAGYDGYRTNPLDFVANLSLLHPI